MPSPRVRAMRGRAVAQYSKPCSHRNSKYPLRGDRADSRGCRYSPIDDGTIYPAVKAPKMRWDALAGWDHPRVLQALRQQGPNNNWGGSKSTYSIGNHLFFRSQSTNAGQPLKDFILLSNRQNMAVGSGVNQNRRMRSVGTYVEKKGQSHPRFSCLVTLNIWSVGTRSGRFFYLSDVIETAIDHTQITF